MTAPTRGLPDDVVVWALAGIDREIDAVRAKLAELEAQRAQIQKVAGQRPARGPMSETAKQKMREAWVVRREKKPRGGAPTGEPQS